MTRRLHACLTCTPTAADTPRSLRRGRTRHKNGICSRCRRSGATSDGNVVRLPIEVDLRGRGA